MHHSLFRPLGIALAVASFFLSGCASMMKPSDEKLASLPIVEIGNAAPAGEFVLKIPSGKPVPVKVAIDGTALVNPVEQTLNASVPHDVYVYKMWASEDGHQWKRADDMFGVRVTIALPSNESPKGGDIHLTVNRKTVQ